jgi:hypothetical protein
MWQPGRASVIAAVLAGAACVGGEQGGACGPCPAGELCGEDDQCHPLCNRSGDCPPCHACRQGLCTFDAQCDAGDPCAVCSPGLEVCLAGQCLLACVTTPNCPQGQECVALGSVHYCAEPSSLQLLAPHLGIQESSGPTYRVRGALLPWAGTSSSASFRLQPAVE